MKQGDRIYTAIISGNRYRLSWDVYISSLQGSDDIEILRPDGPYKTPWPARLAWDHRPTAEEIKAAYLQGLASSIRETEVSIGAMEAQLEHLHEILADRSCPDYIFIDDLPNP